LVLDCRSSGALVSDCLVMRRNSDQSHSIWAPP
jgi:hypothetical protein